MHRLTTRQKRGTILRAFNYKDICDKLFTSDIVAMLTQIYEFKGRQELLFGVGADVLTHLTEVAKIQSIDASNRIEGIYTSDDRLRKLAKAKTNPQNRNEQEIAGYRDVLAMIHQNHDYIPLKSSVILQLHRDLYKYSEKSFGGTYKTANNQILEKDESGNEFIRFEPVAAWETPNAIESICAAFDKAVKDEAEPLLAIPAFILDFLCIHPFSDGNGRMSRLLTLLLLYRAGYVVGKYISIEKLVEQSKESYYATLFDSSIDWHEGTNDYEPFVKYTLGTILAAYRDCTNRVEVLIASGLSKSDRVREIIRDRLGKITKREILEEYPDISDVTVQRTLSELLKNEEIIKIGGGRYTEYTWNREKE